METISESQHSFNNNALQIAERFIKIEDTSLLKVGSFGYITSLFSNIMRNSVFHRDMLYNEIFLVSSNLNSTLYNWAKILDFDIELASPSSMDIAITLPISSIEDLATASSSGSKIFTIERSTVFDVSGFKFLLPYDLKIIFRRNANNQLAVSATYDFANYNLKPPSISTPYLKVMLSTENGVSKVTIAATIFQIEKRDWTYTIFSNDILDAGIIEQNYGGNMVSFKVSYNTSSSSLSSFQELETIFNEIDQPTTSKYAYYTFVGSDTVRIYFSNKPTDFRPVFNSKVRLEVFTTLAEESNFDYSGAIVIRDESLKNIAYSCISLSGKAAGGASVKSFRETKIALMEQLRTRKNYTTTYDLETYFKEVKKTKLAANSEFKVVKLRDDFFRRQFSLYMLQRNKSGDVVPTNTIDLSLTLDEIAAMDYSLKPGTLLVYDRIESQYRMLKENELPEVYLQSPDSYVFCNPFLINFDFKEFPKANFYLTNYTKTSNLSYTYYNIDSPFEVVINSLEVSRNPIHDIDGFKVSCFLNTTTLNFDTTKVRVILIKDGVEIGYADMSREGDTSEFRLTVKASDTFDADGNYLVTDTFREIESGSIIPVIRLNGSYTIKLAVLSNEPGVNGILTNLYETMGNLAGYTLLLELESTDQFSFADDLSDLVYSQMNLDTVTGRIVVRKIPVIGALFYLNDVQNAEVMNEVYASILMARGVATALENNTSVDIKFYNTSGLSQYFDVDTVDLRLRMSISLSELPTQSFDETLRNFIASYIEDCNSKAEKRFSISNLIRELETKFPTIRYCKFFSINGGNIQNVEQIRYKNAGIDSLPVSYVPEFISVRKTLPNGTSSRHFAHDIQIDYV